MMDEGQRKDGKAEGEEEKDKGRNRWWGDDDARGKTEGVHEEGNEVPRCARDAQVSVHAQRSRLITARRREGTRIHNRTRNGRPVGRYESTMSKGV
ncbi:hypothetical protein E2C01_011199 [Portunus trituberculatus]|uniref:Uncharacterized protein n=1 Tax=Portunus trituberculatus TaxID=210409 RepID=A0A5B7DAH1_PORTR|nr:hypothetical protein [Portunus trituberculatus]